MIDLDKEGEQQLLRFYLGGYLNGTPQNPFDAGLLGYENGEVVIPDTAVEAGIGNRIDELIKTSGDDGRIDWDEFKNFVLETYPEVRNAPGSIEEARHRYGDWSDDSTWFSVDVTGSMSPYRRHIMVRREDLRSAIDSMQTLTSDILYPDNTVFVGEHLRDSAVVETTFMIKRPDDMWDYFAYASDGKWTGTIASEPNDLQVPTQCVGCHFGTRQFEPERSFPAHARPGPDGLRLIHVDERLRSSDIAGALREHLKRSDTILGLYVTLYLTQIRAADENDLDEWEVDTLKRLSLD